MTERIRQLTTISTSERCARICAIDHFPGSGCHLSCLGFNPRMSFFSFAAVTRCTFSASCPSTLPSILAMYCWAVSAICVSDELFSPNPSAARKPAQFFNGIDHGAFGNVAGDFHLPDFPRKDEVNHSVLRFLVGLQARQNFSRRNADFGQLSEAQDRIGDASCGHTVRATHT